MTAADLSAVYRNALSGKGLDSLRRDVQMPDRAGIREVAEQFEALFMQTMLKSMRDATPQSDLFGSGAMRQYRGLFDQQLALDVAHGPGLGLADQVERQLLQHAGLMNEAPPLDRSLSRYQQNSIAAIRPRPGRLRRPLSKASGLTPNAPGGHWASHPAH